MSFHSGELGGAAFACHGVDHLRHFAGVTDFNSFPGALRPKRCFTAKLFGIRQFNGEKHLLTLNFLSPDPGVAEHLRSGKKFIFVAIPPVGAVGVLLQGFLQGPEVLI